MLIHVHVHDCTYTSNDCNTLQELVKRLRVDILLLRRELEEEQIHRERIETENSELKGKWDSKVNKLMEKVERGRPEG